MSMAPGRQLNIGEAYGLSPRVVSSYSQPGLSCFRNGPAMHKNNKERINKKNSKRPPQGSIQPEGFPVVRPDVAGIDLGSEGHWVCAPTVDGAALEVQEFGATTPELERMAAWLRERKVVSVAMESTGVYWVPPHEVLERHGIEVVLGKSGSTSG